jgi:molybdate transport system substrate-binding protein
MRGVLALLFALVGTSLPRPAHAAPGLTVAAASSLTEAMADLAADWRAAGHPAITVTTDASSRLARQIAAGAPVDVFVSADTAWVDYLAAQDAVDPARRVTLLSNRLVVVVPAQGGLAIRQAADLAQPALRHLALAGETVPAGRYAQEALTALGVWPQVVDRVVRGDTVRTPLAWVAAGDADAALVYATDARVAPQVRVAWEVPASAHAPIRYVAVVPRTAPDPAEAARFLAFLQRAEAMARFRARGFLPPPPP